MKMVHNGIEYGLMQAYAEGFDIMRTVRVRPRPARDRRHLALRIGRALSWLLELLHDGARERRATTSSTSPATSRTRARGAGRSSRRSTRACPRPVISAALFARFASRQDESFAAKINAALRNQFGGHAREERMSVVRARSTAPNPLEEGLRATAHARAVRADDLRRLRRPDAAQALSRALRARVPRLAAAEVRRSSASRAPR